MSEQILLEWHDEKGTGLGLSTVRNIVRQNNGETLAESTLEEGTPRMNNGEIYMKKTTILFCLLLLLTPALLSAADEAVLRAEAGTLVKTYVTELKATLKTAMQDGGPVMAIGSCRVKAPAIARRLGHETGWQIGRTSLRVRNPDNRPDAWEKEGLEAFKALHKQGVPASKLVQSALVDDEEGQRFRFLKAIPTGGLCLSCHGEKLAPKVRQALKENYPQDQARGFRAGDLRGAFSLSKPLN